MPATLPKHLTPTDRAWRLFLFRDSITGDGNVPPPKDQSEGARIISQASSLVRTV